MFQSLIQNRRYMGISQGIKDRFSFSAEFYQVALFQNPQLMGDRTLTHSKEFCNVTYAQFGSGQRIEYPNPGGITKDFKQFSQAVQIFFFWNNRILNLMMDVVAITTVFYHILVVHNFLHSYVCYVHTDR